MTRCCSIRWICLVLGTLILTGPVASGQSVKPDQHGFVAAQPEDLRPAEGTTQIRISGDPTKPGMYVVRNTFPAGRIGTPHFHNQDRLHHGAQGHLVGGTRTGKRQRRSQNKMIPMKAGATCSIQPTVIILMGRRPTT